MVSFVFGLSALFNTTFINSPQVLNAFFQGDEPVNSQQNILTGYATTPIAEVTPQLKRLLRPEFRKDLTDPHQGLEIGISPLFESLIAVDILHAEFFRRLVLAQIVFVSEQRGHSSK